MNARQRYSCVHRGAPGIKRCLGVVSKRNRNVPVLTKVTSSAMARGRCSKTRLRVLPGAVGASARPRGRQRPQALVIVWPPAPDAQVLNIVAMPPSPGCSALGRHAGRVEERPRPVDTAALRPARTAFAGGAGNLAPAHQAPSVAQLHCATRVLAHQHRPPRAGASSAAAAPPRSTAVSYCITQSLDRTPLNVLPDAVAADPERLDSLSARGASSRLAQSPEHRARLLSGGVSPVLAPW